MAAAATGEPLEAVLKIAALLFAGFIVFIPVITMILMRAASSPADRESTHRQSVGRVGGESETSQKKAA